MRWGLPSSLLFHAAVLGAGLVALQNAPPLREAPPAPVIPIDLVAIAPQTNIQAAAEAPAETLPETATELETDGAPPEEAAAAAPAAPSEAAPEPEPAPAPRAQAPKPPPAERPAQARAAPQARPLDLDRLAEMVDRSKPVGAQARPRAAAPDNAELADRPRRRAGLGSSMTASAEDALRAQLKRCWRAPVDLPNPERLVVKVRVSLNRDGTIARPPEVVDAASEGDGPMKTAEERATRAVRVCAPYTLPPEGYEIWSDLILRFDPREMLDP